MKSFGIITLGALMMIVMFSGMPNVVNAQLSCGADEVIVAGKCVNAFDEVVKNDLGVSTDLDLYSQGSTVKISGKINNFENLSGGAVTMIIYSPSGGIVQIAQLIPNSDGSFGTQMKADGPQWKVGGDYTISANYGSTLKSNVSFEYSGGSGNVISGGSGSVPPPPPPITCASDEHLVNGKCVDKIVEPPITCASDEHLVNGKCVDKIVEPPVDKVICGVGTEPNANGICVISQPDCPEGYTMKGGVCVEDGGCLIATAAYGTELAPQVQLLREIRDNTLFSTSSGTAFMSGFNTLYYSFAPTVADWERESPMFKEIVKTAITPMLSTLSIMSLADEGSEVEVLGLGISVIALNLGMYIAAPALIGFKVNQIIKSRK